MICNTRDMRSIDTWTYYYENIHISSHHSLSSIAAVRALLAMFFANMIYDKYDLEMLLR